MPKQKAKPNIKASKLPSKRALEQDLPDQPYWNMKHYLFLQKYRECLDEKEAAKTALMDSSELKKVLCDKKIRLAMEDAKNDFIEALNLTPKKAQKEFMDTYNAVKKRFETSDNVAGPLVNAATTMLKATGLLDNVSKQTSPKVSISINLSHKNQPEDNKLNIKIINDSVYE
jgi:hypothetical protein